LIIPFLNPHLAASASATRIGAIRILWSCKVDICINPVSPALNAGTSFILTTRTVKRSVISSALTFRKLSVASSWPGILLSEDIRGLSTPRNVCDAFERTTLFSFVICIATTICPGPIWFRLKFQLSLRRALFKPCRRSCIVLHASVGVKLIPIERSAVLLSKLILPCVTFVSYTNSHGEWVV
jgi:hypothetical protein